MIRILGALQPDYERLLTSDALGFVARLQRRFELMRQTLLSDRLSRQNRIRSGEMPGTRPETRRIREGDWQVRPAPRDLQRRAVEITGPVERKLMINALNSGADVYMADFGDSLSPTWANVIEGQIHLREAVRRRLTFQGADGNEYRLNEKLATLGVRPRGWHFVEKHLTEKGRPISASLVDFGLYFYHNARELVARGSGPYFYLPQLECANEARLWHLIFEAAESELGLPTGTVRATVLIETILASFEMEEILYELKEHATALNAGLWNYFFSAIQKFSHSPDFQFPDRSQLTGDLPFMQAYAERLVRTCHRRGAHAIGSLSAFIPSRRDPEMNRAALEKVREDMDREALQGFDGTWVAHPDLVPLARESFEKHLLGRPHQLEAHLEEALPEDARLLDFEVVGGQITEAGVASHVSVALAYLEAWLRGQGAVTIHNLREDAATAEISSAELWHWIRHGAVLNDGRSFTPKLYGQIRDRELLALGGLESGRFRDATRVLDQLVLDDKRGDFLTVSAYKYLEPETQENQRAS